VHLAAQFGDASAGLLPHVVGQQVCPMLDSDQLVAGP
jgi:hypothetical protein